MDIQTQTVNFEELQQALQEAPGLAFTYCRQELDRAGKRFKRRLITERMSGAGINWPDARKAGGGTGSTVTGATLEDLVLTIRGARFLIPHEFGETITPPFLEIKASKFDLGRLNLGDQKLTLHTGRGGRQYFILRLGHPITIPARLGFRALWASMLPDTIAKLNNALARAMQVAFERRLKTITSLIKKVVA